jgi:hypothetical protein
MILVRDGGGEGNHYFTTKAAWVWFQIPHIIFQFSYSGVDVWGDPDMVLPPREAFD